MPPQAPATFIDLIIMVPVACLVDFKRRVAEAACRTWDFPDSLADLEALRAGPGVRRGGARLKFRFQDPTLRNDR